MKKLLIFLILLVPFLVKAQYPTKQKVGNDSSLVYAPGAIQAIGGFINGVYTDTTAANLTRIRQYPLAQMATTSDNSLWLRNSTATQWVKPPGGGSSISSITIYTDSSIIICYSDGTCDTISMDNRIFVTNTSIGCNSLLEGGVVTWSGTGLKFYITAATYYINCKLYHSASDSVTLAPADPTNPRYDVIGVDTTGFVYDSTGQAAVAPFVPQPYSYQLDLTHILISPGDTIPGCVSNVLIYDEDEGLPDEWDTDTIGVDIIPSQTPVASHGIRSIYFNNVSTGELLTLNTTPQVNPAGISTLYFKIKVTDMWQQDQYNSNKLYIWFSKTIVLPWDGLSGSSTPVFLLHGTYGFDSTRTDWQTIAIPMADFNLGTTGVDSINILYILTNWNNGVNGSFYIDEINFQNGGCLNPPPITSFVTHIFTTQGVLTDTLWQIKNYTDTSLVNIFDRTCGLVNGGIVSWDSLLVFTVSPSVYRLCCDNERRTSDLTQVALSAADPSLPRFDMIGLDSTGVIVVEGTPSADPQQPQPTGCQIALTYILIGAGATEPTGTDCGVITNLTIYDETGGTEWTPGTSGLTASFTDTDNPFHLTKDGDLNSFNQSQSFSFTKGSGTINMNDYYALRFYIRLKSAFHNRLQIGIFFNNTVDGGGSAPVQLSNGLYNFSRTTTGTYQEIVIPMSVFLAFNPGAPSNINVNKLWFLALNQSNADGFYIDYVQLLKGVCQPPQAASWVSRVDAGSLSPLFTTTVTNPTTTPYISFAQQSAAANTYYGVGGTTGVPSFLPISNIRGQVVTILSDTTISICSSDAVPVCDTFIVNTVSAIQAVRIISDTELEVCGVSLCDTLTVTTTTIGQPITADNGLTMNTPSNVQFGGTLIKNTTINTGGFSTTWTGANTNTTLTAISTSSGTGFDASSSSGYGSTIQSTSGKAALLYITPSSTNTVVTIAEFLRASSGTAGDGIGGSIDFLNKVSGGGNQVSNRFISRFSTVDNSTRVSRFNITGVDNAVTDTIFTLAGNGKLTLNKYTGTTFRSVDTTTYKPLMASTSDGSVMTGYWAGSGGSLGTQAKGLFVEFPSSSELVGMWMTPANITITAVKAVLVGSSTPSVTYDLKHGSDITSGTVILSAPVAITTTTTPTSSTSFSDATVPAGNYIWFYTTAQSGTVTSIWITVYYTID